MVCAAFFFSGLAFLPRLGIEGDEALFATGMYPPRGELYSVAVGRSHIPIMLMSYVGALKCWIYKPILSVLGAGPLTMRVPVLLAGTASLWLFFLLLRRIAGDRAAWIGCGLLAVDSTYLLTVCFDWGPVAFQHLLLIGGALLLVRFYQDRGDGALFCGLLLLGLALWDKALAVWLLSGMGVAAILALPRQIVGTFTFRRLAIAASAFILGAFPLLLYNSGHRWETFRGNYQRDTTPLRAKAIVLKATAAGGGLLDWLNAQPDHTPAPHLHTGALPRISAGISAVADHPRHDLLLYAFVLAILLVPILRGDDLRTVIVALLTMTVAWVEMAITANAGMSVHHTVLLWPLPHLIIAVSFAAASRRMGRAGIPAVAAAVVVLMTSAALVTNEYYTLILRYGGSQVWNLAIYPLADYLKATSPARVVALDWGIVEPLEFLTEGRLHQIHGDELVSNPEPALNEREAALAMISDPGSVYVAHTHPFEVFPDKSGRLVKLAEAGGYRREILRVIDDGYGRDVFEVYRFTPAR